MLKFLGSWKGEIIVGLGVLGTAFILAHSVGYGLWESNEDWPAGFVPRLAVILGWIGLGVGVVGFLRMSGESDRQMSAVMNTAIANQASKLGLSDYEKPYFRLLMYAAFAVMCWVYYEVMIHAGEFISNYFALSQYIS